MDIHLDQKYLYGKMPSKMKRVDELPKINNEKLPKETQEAVQKINDREGKIIIIDSI